MPPPPGHQFQAPNGTRDFYPAELARLRFIQDAWRRASVRHGFDEIDGPTFEHLDLYTVKSGEGIVSELFSFRRAGGEKDFALRPEFTPTLARMYAARAAQLPKPVKWFWLQNCFRAERPQRGRLREFYQWNADLVGDDSPAADAELIGLMVDFLSSLGLTPKDVRVKVSHRYAIARNLTAFGIDEPRHAEGFALLDAIDKLKGEEFARRSIELGVAEERLSRWLAFAKLEAPATAMLVSNPALMGTQPHALRPEEFAMYELEAVHDALKAAGLLEWCDYKPSLARGLAYYTGTVFEVHEASGAERAIAGGGRYDKLVELFGGPSTPAIGFGMGDVVLSLVLADRGLMPGDEAIADRLGLRPDVYVLSSGNEGADAAVLPAVMALRRAGLHARRSYKATRNVGKLLKDAAALRARHAVIIESATHATLKHMDTGEQSAEPIELERLAEALSGPAHN